MPAVDTRASRCELLPHSVVLFGGAVRDQLLANHRSYARALPWRTLRHKYATSEQERAYVVLVSEVMLQQTQASRVVELLPPFLERFHSIDVLAQASTADILHAWRGLGYNRRGLRLHELARTIVGEYAGRIPSRIHELNRLPGIGRYTAGAIACFAFEHQIAVVDTNVLRVLSRVFFRCYSMSQRLPGSAIERIATWLLPPKQAIDWHEALMDHGSGVCTARAPNCRSCSLSALCLSSGGFDGELFDPHVRRRPEPTIGGVPRRLWRGRVLEWLRAQSDPRPLSEMIEQFAAGGDSDHFATELRQLVGILHEEGLIAVVGALSREGALISLGRH